MSEQEPMRLSSPIAPMEPEDDPFTSVPTAERNPTPPPDPTSPTAPQQSQSIVSKRNCNLFVASLPRTVQDADLRDCFSQFGKVVSAKVMVDLTTGQSRQFGFVRFADEGSAADAKAEMNGKLLPRSTAGTAPLHVEFASHDDRSHEVENERVYVRNLPSWVTSSEFTKAFEGFGAIREISILTDPYKRVTNRGVGIIRYATVEAARDAIEQMTNSTVFGEDYPIQIRFMENHEMRHSRHTKKKGPPPAIVTTSSNSNLSTQLETSPTTSPVYSGSAPQWAPPPPPPPPGPPPIQQPLSVYNVGYRPPPPMMGNVPVHPLSVPVPQTVPVVFPQPPPGVMYPVAPPVLSPPPYYPPVVTVQPPQQQTQPAPQYQYHDIRVQGPLDYAILHSIVQRALAGEQQFQPSTLLPTPDGSYIVRVSAEQSRTPAIVGKLAELLGPSRVSLATPSSS